jgi:hypothetical protein
MAADPLMNWRRVSIECNTRLLRWSNQTMSPSRRSRKLDSRIRGSGDEATRNGNCNDRFAGSSQAFVTGRFSQGDDNGLIRRLAWNGDQGLRAVFTVCLAVWEKGLWLWALPSVTRCWKRRCPVADC